MRTILALLTLSLGALHAQPSCISIQDTIYSMGPSGEQLMTGYIQLSLGQFTDVGGFTVTASLTTLNITAVANNLNACLPPSVIVQAAYTVTTGGRTPVHYTTYWYIPNTGGPYQLTGVPSGIVNVSGTAVSWVSGLNFVNVQVNDTPAINGTASVSVASVQSVTGLTLYSTLGTLTNATFSDGPIERSPVTINGNMPNTIYGPQGIPGPGASGFSGTKVAGSCTFNVANGLIVSISGC
jgi:hypothetical protein